jgi:pyruvate-formate lyase-activating enzyme
VASTADLPHAGGVAGPSGFLPERIIHLHPTRLCNLACVHCYSTSAPGLKEALDPDVLCPALEALRTEGYELISLSGGEPLVYGRLREVVERSRELGFRVTMITNGLLVTEKTMPLLSTLDAVAVSFDGLEQTHNAIRGRPDAFERAGAGLQRLASAGVPVGAAISLTREAIPELPDLADHLVELGARTIQVRPVARAGRARSLDDGVFGTPTDHARLYLVVLALQHELPEVRFNCDLAPAHGLWEQRESYAGLLGDCAEQQRLAELVNPLVITETGRLKPIAYDFDPGYDVADVARLTTEGLTEYKRRRLPDLQALIGGELARLEGRHELVDWFDQCTRVSEERGARARAGSTAAGK